MIGYADREGNTFCIPCGTFKAPYPIKKYQVTSDVLCVICQCVVIKAPKSEPKSEIKRLNCNSTQWFTPKYIRDLVHEFYPNGFLDPATSAANPLKAKKFFTSKDDGLSRVWDQPTYVNPPYGEVTPMWCQKIIIEAMNFKPIVALMPCGARFSTRYFQPFLKAAQAVCFVDHRVPFERADGSIEGTSMYDTAIYGFNVDSRFKDVFEPLGVTWEIK